MKLQGTFAAALLIALIAAATTSWSRDRAAAGNAEEGIAETIEFDEPPFCNLADALKVSQWSGECELRKKVQEARMRIDVYHDGNHVKQMRTVGIASDEVDRLPFAVHAIDLDYVPLGEGKPNHMRVHFKTSLGKGVLNVAVDIDKDLFNVTAGGARGRFPATASSENEIPLFYFMRGSDLNRPGRAGSTVDEVVAGNEQALVVTIEVE